MFMVRSIVNFSPFSTSFYKCHLTAVSGVEIVVISNDTQKLPYLHVANLMLKSLGCPTKTLVSSSSCRQSFLQLCSVVTAGSYTCVE